MRNAQAVAASPVGLDPVLRARVVDDVIGFRIYELLNQRTLSMLGRGVEPGAWTSLIKLFWSLLAQSISTTTVDIAGLAGVAGEPAVWFDFLRYRMSTIAGGTSEIQKNLLAERLLGLPR